MKKLLYLLLVLFSSVTAYSQMLFSENLTMTIDSTKTLQGSLMPEIDFKTEKENVFTFMLLRCTLMWNHSGRRVGE